MNLLSSSPDQPNIPSRLPELAALNAACDLPLPRRTTDREMRDVDAFLDDLALATARRDASTPDVHRERRAAFFSSLPRIHVADDLQRSGDTRVNDPVNEGGRGESPEPAAVRSGTPVAGGPLWASTCAVGLFLFFVLFTLDPFVAVLLLAYLGVVTLAHWMGYA